MAPLPKSLPLFFLITLLLSAQTLARESRFFSKTTRESTEEATKPATTVKVESSKEQEEEEQPAFLPQTSDNAPYGLYGRQTDLEFSPTTTTTTTTKYNQQKYQPRTEQPAFDNNKNTKYFNNMETFETKEEEEETTPSTTTEPESYNSGHRKNYASELQGLDGYAKRSAYGNGYYSGERQGMSDTRFMANGKYYYDVNSERPAAYNNYGGAYRSKAGRAAEYYNNDGYYSGSTESFNNKYYKNTRPGFRGEQSLDEEEFDFDP